jgi:hypothetical protein
MTTYHSFQSKEFDREMMDPNQRVEDHQFIPILKSEIQNQFNQPRVEYTNCCTRPQPCHTWIQYKPQLSECPITYLSWAEATHGKVTGAEIGKKDSRIWVADLNPMHYNRALIDGSIWWAESTKPHIRNRQAFAQYLQSTLYPQSSPHEKKISRIEDAYAVLTHKFGPNVIQYTSF